MHSLDKIEHEYKTISSWNHSHKKRSLVFYPKNINEVKKFIRLIKRDKKNYIIKTGACSYGSKSINADNNTVIASLIRINKIIKINKTNLIVQSGMLISDLTREIKDKRITLFSVPGGSNISIGGAISANVIGKDSSKQNSSFGDSVNELDVLTVDGNIVKIRTAKELSKYIGGFGFAGIILQANLKIKKISSNNLIVQTTYLKDLNDIKKHLDKKINDFRYVIVNPFFKKKSFAMAYDANFVKNKNNIFKKINLKPYFFEKYLLRFLSYFLNKTTWTFFYFLYFYTKNHKKKLVNLHNFYYESKYKQLIPFITRDGLVEYEVMIKNNFERNINKIKNFIQVNKFNPIYIIIKKLYKSKNKNYNYSFNDNGYAVAISLDRKNLTLFKQKKFLALLDKNNFKLNFSKTDQKILNRCDNKNFLFLSSYKKMIQNTYEISRQRARNI
tara:strand:- start:1984 stop:3315 length:1332 start_codon:yes stop_codon:yes gene_type:complete